MHILVGTYTWHIHMAHTRRTYIILCMCKASAHAPKAILWPFTTWFLLSVCTHNTLLFVPTGHFPRPSGCITTTVPHSLALTLSVSHCEIRSCFVDQSLADDCTCLIVHAACCARVLVNTGTKQNIVQRISPKQINPLRQTSRRLKRDPQIPKQQLC